MLPFWMYDESVPTNWIADVFVFRPFGLCSIITYGSLFTGIGAGHEALRDVSHQWVFALERDRYC